MVQKLLNIEQFFVVENSIKLQKNDFGRKN